MTEVDYLIIGTGPAAVVAAETLRDNDPDGSIGMISRENIPPYSRMAIPYLLAGNIDRSGTYLRKTPNFFKDRHMKVYHGNVVSIEPDAKRAYLETGASLGYGKLLIASGASPIKPPVPGLDLPGVHHCWTLADADAICAQSGEGSDIVLMGAGFIGCIILEALAARGARLTVVEAEDRMVPRMMNETAGGMIKSWCEGKGMTIHTSTRISGVSEDHGRLRVDMDSGDSTLADLVVVAAGVKANTDFLQGSGIETADGINVDQYMQTNVADIYAAGDCAEGRDFSTGGWSVHAIQPTATEHGRIAALNMTGHKAAYKGSLIMNVLDTAGLISSSFGQWQGVEGGEAAESVDMRNYRYTRLAFDGDRLVGALTLGRTNAIGVFRGLIQSRCRLGHWKDRLMRNPNRIVEAYIANTHS